MLHPGAGTCFGPYNNIIADAAQTKIIMRSAGKHQMQQARHPRAINTQPRSNQLICNNLHHVPAPECNTCPGVRVSVSRCVTSLRGHVSRVNFDRVDCGDIQAQQTLNVNVY